MWTASSHQGPTLVLVTSAAKTLPARASNTYYTSTHESGQDGQMKPGGSDSTEESQKSSFWLLNFQTLIKQVQLLAWCIIKPPVLLAAVSSLAGTWLSLQQPHEGEILR